MYFAAALRVDMWRKSSLSQVKFWTSRNKYCIQYMKDPIAFENASYIHIVNLMRMIVLSLLIAAPLT
jgi:hypothetical protein